MVGAGQSSSTVCCGHCNQTNREGRFGSSLARDYPANFRRARLHSDAPAIKRRWNPGFSTLNFLKPALQGDYRLQCRGPTVHPPLMSRLLPAHVRGRLPIASQKAVEIRRLSVRAAGWWVRFRYSQNRNYGPQAEALLGCSTRDIGG